MPYYWIVYDTTGEEVRQTSDFASRADAEEWMRDNWSVLVDEGGAGVRLATEDGVVYDMGLAGL